MLQQHDNIYIYIPPGELTWNPRIDPWKIIFLYNPVVLGFHVNLQESNLYIYITPEKSNRTPDVDILHATPQTRSSPK